MKSGPSYNMLGSHGSPQCSFFQWSGTYDGVIISGSSASAIRLYLSPVDVSVGVLLLLLSIVCGVAESSLETVSTCGVPLPPCSQIGGVVVGRMTLKVCGLFAVVLVVLDSYQSANSGTSSASSSSLSLS